MAENKGSTACKQENLLASSSSENTIHDKTQDPLSSPPLTQPPDLSDCKDWINMTIARAQLFLQELNDTHLKRVLGDCKSGTTVMLPPPPIGGLTQRLLVSKHEGRIACIQRKIFVELKAFVRHHSLTIVQGPAGIGKSFALYYLYCTLSLDPKNRVIYIPDGELLNSCPEKVLIQRIAAAFAVDGKFLQKHLASISRTMEGSDWCEIMTLLDMYCEQHGLNFIAVFDQYDGLKSSLRNSSPTNLLSWTLNFGRCNVVTSAYSYTNDTNIRLNLKSSVFSFTKGFTYAEFQAWRVRNEFNPPFSPQHHPKLTEASSTADITQAKCDIYYERLDEYLGLIPYELHHLNEQHHKHPNRHLSDLLEEYETIRLQEMSEVHHSFYKALDPEDQDAYWRTMFCIRSHRSQEAGRNVIYDKRLFYVNSDNVVTAVIPCTMKLVNHQVQNR